MSGSKGLAGALTTLALVFPACAAMAQAKPAPATPQGKSAPAAAQAKPAGGGYAERFANECAACHGANGKSEIPGTPILAGQHSYYAVTQLFLFREGRRNNEAMTAVAKTMKDADLRGFSDYIGTLPPLPPAALEAPLDAARMARGQTLAQERKCLFCHGPDLSGGQQVPRVAGQREEYLRESLQGFRTGKRAGYTPAMIEPVSPLSAEDVDTLAYFVAHLPQAAKGSTPK
jgi:cytochrome c553